MKSRTYFVQLLVLFTLVACSSSSKKSSSDTPEVMKNDDIFGECPANYLCARGEGDSHSESDFMSKKELAAYFEVNIQSDMSITKTEVDFVNHEEATSYVNEKVDQVVRGVEVLKRSKKNGVFYSLAVLDKEKSLRILRKEMRNLDEQLITFYGRGNPLLVVKLQNLLMQRQSLAQRAILLGSGATKAPVSWQEIQALVEDNWGKFTVAVVANESKLDLTVSKKISSSLTKIGYKVTAQNDQAVSDYLVKIKVVSEKEYLNVKGFKKFRFTLQVQSFRKGKKLGGINSTIVANGRSKVDAYGKVKKQIYNNYLDKIEELNIF